jgi:hypothetical protein
MSDERAIDEGQVRREHEEEIRRPILWAYLALVLVGGMLLMIGLIAALGSTV